ncbi:MAG: T9SS type A sorting domain-containing protein [bacterium]|nr:T9SS type A sorting domain-containing protein [bacterium]
MIPEALLSEIRAFCRENANPERVEKYSRYFVEGYDAYGVGQKTFEEYYKTLLKNYKDYLGFDGFMDLGDMLVKSPKYEEGSFAIVFAIAFRSVMDSQNRVIELTRPPYGMTDDVSEWTLSGDFFKEGVEVGAQGLRPDGGGGDSEGARSAPLRDTSSDLQLEARPNPFNPDIDISFALANACPIELAIYDLRDSKVEVIAESVLPPGLHTLNWNGKGHSAGVYFVRLTTENQSAVKKVTLLK